jgi:hypothetical protein
MSIHLIDSLNLISVARTLIKPLLLPSDLQVEAVLTAMPDWAELKARVVVDKIRSEPHFRSFMMAWLVTKLTEPLRLVVTVGITPRIARALGRAPPKEPRS